MDYKSVLHFQQQKLKNLLQEIGINHVLFTKTQSRLGFKVANGSMILSP